MRNLCSEGVGEGGSGVWARCPGDALSVVFEHESGEVVPGIAGTKVRRRSRTQEGTFERKIAIKDKKRSQGGGRAIWVKKGTDLGLGSQRWGKACREGGSQRGGGKGDSVRKTENRQSRLTGRKRKTKRGEEKSFFREQKDHPLCFALRLRKLEQEGPGVSRKREKGGPVKKQKNG